MKTMVTTKGLPGVCPRCGDALECASSTFEAAVPSVGDLAVCLGCGLPMFYTEGLRLREAPREELLKLPREAREQLARVMAAKKVEN